MASARSGGEGREPGPRGADAARMRRMIAGGSPPAAPLGAAVAEEGAYSRPEGMLRRLVGRREGERWSGVGLDEALIGAAIGYLFTFLVDLTEVISGQSFGPGSDTVRIAAALRPRLGPRGVPRGSRSALA